MSDRVELAQLPLLTGEELDELGRSLASLSTVGRRSATRTAGGGPSNASRVDSTGRVSSRARG